jgi:ABC-type multidrug transport system permease subunit
MIGFQANFGVFLMIAYGLAMSSTALAVLLGCAVEDPKLAQEMLPILFVPQMLFAGFFVTPSLIPVWLRWAQYRKWKNMMVVCHFQIVLLTFILANTILVSSHTPQSALLRMLSV